MKLPYGEDVGHYWDTSRTSPEEWIAKARKLIEGHGGKVTGEGFGDSEGRAAYLVAFCLGEDSFRVVWPVLPSSTGKDMMARRQAATMLYHDIKAKLMTASVLGNRAAFFSYLLLPDGRQAVSVAVPELVEAFPKMLLAGD